MDRPIGQDRGPGPSPGSRIDRRTGAVAPRLSGPARVGLVALAAALTATLAVAGRLTPDPRGFGTHEQLGRPPCAILILTGRPCPTCGMTTAFAWFARREPARSWGANPTGLLLATATVPMIPWLLASAAAGRPRVVRSAGDFLMALVVVAAAVTVLTWVVRRSLSLI